MRNIQIPLNTSYAWNISHALATLYHPYANEPAALTEYLKRKLQVQRAKHRSHSHPAHIEQSVPLGRNIIYSSTIMVITVVTIVLWTTLFYLSLLSGRLIVCLGHFLCLHSPIVPV